MKFWDAIQAVRRRGEFMQEAVPGGRGRDGCIDRASDRGRQIAVRRSFKALVCASRRTSLARTRTVIAGNKAAVERAVELAKAKGAKRAVCFRSARRFTAG